MIDGKLESEMEVVRAICTFLEGLDRSARSRVLNWVASWDAERYAKELMGPLRERLGKEDRE